MKNINITEENYDKYYDLYLLKKGIEPPNKRNYLREYLIAFTDILIVGCIFLILNNLLHNIPLLILFSTVSIPMVVGISTIVLIKKDISKFKKENPNINIDINISELEKELEKYQELSKIPKNIEKLKEEHLTVDSNKIKNMSTEEKIRFLEQEKLFWDQVRVQEKYTEINQKEDNVQKIITL